MRAVYLFFTLGLGIIITVAVSLSCSYWFFHSLAGGEGRGAVLTGVAGCAIQLFGYGFAANYLDVSKWQRIVAVTAPLVLSMFTTYSSLVGYIESQIATRERQERVDQEIEQRKAAQSEVVGSYQDAVLTLIRQSTENQKAVTRQAEAAPEGFHSHKKSMLESNQAARGADLQLLTKIESSLSIGENDQVSLDGSEVQPSSVEGLVDLARYSTLAMILICAWLAILFDALPVVGISKLTHQFAGSEANADTQEPQSELPQTQQEQPVAKAQCTSPETSALEPKAEVAKELAPAKIAAPHLVKSLPPKPNVVDDRSESTVVPTLPSLNFGDVSKQIASKELKPTKKSVGEFTGWDRQKIGDYFAFAIASGIVQSSGNSYRLVNNTSRNAFA